MNANLPLSNAEVQMNDLSYSNSQPPRNLPASGSTPVVESFICQLDEDSSNRLACSMRALVEFENKCTIKYLTKINKNLK